MTETNEMDLMCGVSDDEMSRRFVEATRIAAEISKIKGTPVARYDAKKKAVFWEHADGRIEYPN